MKRRFGVPGHPVPVIEQMSDVEQLRDAALDSAAVFRVLVLDDADRDSIDDEHHVGPVALDGRRDCLQLLDQLPDRIGRQPRIEPGKHGLQLVAEQHAGFAAALLLGNFGRDRGPTDRGGMRYHRKLHRPRLADLQLRHDGSPGCGRVRRGSTYVPALRVVVRRKTHVKDQVHIRNAEAAQLARALARQTGRTIGQVVLDALRQYRPHPMPPEHGNRVARWRRLLRRDRARLTRPEAPIEAFYDESTGLPT
jgi:Rv0623-like transcription factor